MLPPLSSIRRVSFGCHSTATKSNGDSNTQYDKAQFHIGLLGDWLELTTEDEQGQGAPPIAISPHLLALRL